MTATSAPRVGTAGSAPGDEALPRFDFRRSSRVHRDSVRGLEVAHEVFARRVASGWGGALRALVQLDPVAVEQVTYDDYVRSMPTPHLLALVPTPALGGSVVVDLDVQLALMLVARLLGGRGDASSAPPLRRPTELETCLLEGLLHHAVAALDDTLRPLADVGAELGAVEYNPQLLQLATPSDPALLLSYRVGVTQGVEADGLLTVCYPAQVLTPLLERLATQAGSGHEPGDADTASAPVAACLEEVDVSVAVRLEDCRLPASEVAALRVGDVVRLDHRVGAPVRGRVGDADVLAGHVGRRGRRLALQVAGWLVEPPALSTPPPHPFVAGQEHP